MKNHIISIKAAWNEVFSNLSYIMGAMALALVVFAFAVLLPNLALLNEVVLGSSAPLQTKINLTLSLLGGIRTNFSSLSAIYTILTAILIGVNTAMIVYLVRKRSARRSLGAGGSGLGQKGIAVGAGGIASGALGIGCAACGSFLLSTILASFGAASALAILPLKGGEFGIASVALLGLMLWIVSKKIAEPPDCEQPVCVQRTGRRSGRLVCKPKNNYD